MGFPLHVCESALAQAGGNAERALEIIIGQSKEVPQKSAFPVPVIRCEMEEAMNRLRSRTQTENLAQNIFLELPKVKKEEGWIYAKLQEAVTLFNIQSNEEAAQLYQRVMTADLTLEKLAQESSILAFQLDDVPLVRRQSSKETCMICGDELSRNLLHFSYCEAQKPASHSAAAPETASAAASPRVCQVCYPCLFDGLHSHFMDNRLPHCVVCNTPMHQSAFEDILAMQEANFSTCLGNVPHKNNKVCTCGALPPSMFAGFAAQNPESIKTHKKDCSFAVIKRMRTQADDLLMHSVLAGGDCFVACPGAGCKSWVEVAVMPHPTTGKPIKIRQCVQCLSCSTTFCPKCGSSPYHFNTECESIASLRGDYSEWMTRGRQQFLRQRAEVDASFQKQLQDYEADKTRVEAEKKQLEAVAREAAADEAYKAQNCKNCPGCGRIVMKVDGCDLMKCGEDYHGGNKQMGCGLGFRWTQAPAYQAQDVQPRQIQFNRERPQQILHKWQLFEGQDLLCDACASPIVGPKFTCINCQSLTICATCESLGPQGLQAKLNPQFYSSHKTGHLFMLDMPPSMN